MLLPADWVLFPDICTHSSVVLGETEPLDFRIRSQVKQEKMLFESYPKFCDISLFDLSES